jgi:hypothetical protein
MKFLIKTTALILISGWILAGCSRGITTYEAANGKAKCRTHIR